MTENYRFFISSGNKTGEESVKGVEEKKFYRPSVDKPKLKPLEGRRGDKV